MKSLQPAIAKSSITARSMGLKVGQTFAKISGTEIEKFGQISRNTGRKHS